MTAADATTLSPPRVRSTVSILRLRATWTLLVSWALSFGLVTWALEAVLLHFVPGAPPEPLSGVFRFIESVLWLGAIVIAAAVAERWPVEHASRQWRRVAAQATLGIALGPLWGTMAYSISTLLMPSWHSRGMWGIIATESKGALFGYITTAILTQVVIRSMKQREREIAASRAMREATEARLNLLKLELQPDAILHAMEALEEQIASGAEAANDSLVLLSDALHEVAAAARVTEVSLSDELSVTEIFVRLHEMTHHCVIDFSANAESGVVQAAVPHLLLHPLVETLLTELGIGGQGMSRRLSITAEAENERLVIQVGAIGPRPGRAHRLWQVRSVANTRERLTNLYGGEDTFALCIDDVDGQLRIELRLPLRALSDGPGLCLQRDTATSSK